jgi:LysM repeat protein
MKSIFLILLLALTCVLSARLKDGCVPEYTVVAGDTLSALATKFGVSVDAIAKANNIQDINFIMTGQKLKIPCP